MKRRSMRVHVASVLFSLSSLAVSAAGCLSSTNTPPPPLDGGFVFPDAANPLLDAGTPKTDSAAPGADATPSGGDAAGSCPGGWVPGASGACVLSLLGAWAPSTDANSDGAATVATLGTVTATSVSVDQSHTGQDGAACGCNAQHLNVPLGRSFPCATSTLEFSYATTVAMGALDTPAVDIRFCSGPCPSVDGGAGGPYFYTGPQYVGSPFAPGSSNCAYEWENDAGTGSLNVFPASALIQSGVNSIPLGTYAAPSSGDACTGSFDTLDVHIQVYNCLASQTGTSTLSDLRVY